MLLASYEQTQTARPGIFFRLDNNRRVKNFCCQGNRFAGQELDSDPEEVHRLIPSDSIEIDAAVKAALEGFPSIARYTLSRKWGDIHCELHCFPCPERIQGELACFLIDRTAEAESSSHLEQKIFILDIINQVIKAFAETHNLSDILRIILLGVTAGSGLAFNRGFVLLSNESRTHLWGCLATGPSTPEEAGKIWQDLAKRKLSLEETLRLYKLASGDVEDIHVNRLVAGLKIPLSDSANFIARAVKEGRSLITGSEDINCPGSRELVEKFGTDTLAVVPLISRENLQGVLLADNLITRKSISYADLNILEIFAKYAADAIENSRLYGKLEQQVCRLKEANEKIIQSRENLVKAEKLSSVAKMALEVAHEIRNPLTVIGGYANSNLKKLEPQDKSFRTLEIISKQVGRIELALDRFSSVVTLSEKKEGKFPLVGLLKDALSMLASSANPEIPSLYSDAQAQQLYILVDQGLFYQAMMAILRKASQITGSLQEISIKVVESGRSGLIFIMGTDNYPNFAENFYRLFRESKGDLINQDTAVALEILQHYGGGVGLSSDEENNLRVYIELPLYTEEK
jgi:signal transduction histidine kinase